MTNFSSVYKIIHPEAQTTPVVIDSPHSGLIYPADFRYACDINFLDRAADKFIDELYEAAPTQGIPLLAALFPRSYIDANRAEDDIDPDLLATDWPGETMPSFRSAAGHGLIHRLIRSGYPIYNGRLTVDEVQNRIENYYRPYHAALKKLLDDTHYKFGQVFHIDCHSMNSIASKNSAFSQSEADFVLGDRDGTTCDPKFTRNVKDFLESLGYRVFINDPYKGVEILKRYANPQMGRHSLQIEINKALYLNEATLEKNSKYNKLRKNIEKLSQFVADWANARKISIAAD